MLTSSNLVVCIKIKKVGRGYRGGLLSYVWQIIVINWYQWRVEIYAYSSCVKFTINEMQSTTPLTWMCNLFILRACSLWWSQKCNEGCYMLKSNFI